jgi:predicted dehydrogenase
MNEQSSSTPSEGMNRREFVKASALTVGTLAAAQVAMSGRAFAANDETIRVGVIGCGGRGTGAAFNALQADDRVSIVALADLFPDRLESSRNGLAERGPRGSVADDRCYVGFDAYQRLLGEKDIDYVILATPPHFRPAHFEASIAAGKHVFMEKPVAVDPPGIRKVIAAGEAATKRGLSVVAGTQRRHQRNYQEAMKRIRAGELGDILAARCYWNMGSLWKKDPRPEWSEMEWQLRNWLYFTWLSGDHICEQHVHNLDIVNWAIGDHPVRALGLGGRQVRTQPVYGNIYDHHAVEYEYENGAFLLSMCRQIGGCANRVDERLHGTKGRMYLRPNVSKIHGGWEYDGGNTNPYVVEHEDLVASLTGAGRYWNEAQNVAESTLTAIMGRISNYTGQEVTWEQALNSELDLTPPAYEFGDLAMRPVAMPGTTPLI